MLSAADFTHSRIIACPISMGLSLAMKLDGAGNTGLATDAAKCSILGYAG
jgi:hypothetical protein